MFSLEILRSITLTIFQCRMTLHPKSCQKLRFWELVVHRRCTMFDHCLRTILVFQCQNLLQDMDGSDVETKTRFQIQCLEKLNHRLRPITIPSWAFLEERWTYFLVAVMILVWRISKLSFKYYFYCASYKVQCSSAMKWMGYSFSGKILVKKRKPREKKVRNLLPT